MTLTTVWRTLSRNRMLCSSIYLFVRLLSLQINWKHLEDGSGSPFFRVAHTYIKLSLWEASWVRLSPASGLHLGHTQDTFACGLVQNTKVLGKANQDLWSRGLLSRQVRCVPLTDSATDVPLWTQKVTSLRNAHHGNFLRFSRTLSSPWMYAERLLFSFPFGRSQSCQAIEVHAAGEKFGHLRMQKRFSLYNEFCFPF